MCGIFGVLSGRGAGYTSRLLKDIVDYLFIFSESRGKEAAGIAVLNNDVVSIYKEPVPASLLIRTKSYKLFLNTTINEVIIDKSDPSIKKPIAMLGHTRLATNGIQTDNDNNSPIISGRVIGVHNGIVVNDDALWARFPLIKRKSLVDSEVLFSLLNLFTDEGLSLIESVQSIFKNMQGSASVAALVSRCDDMLLATNTGSLYSCINTRSDLYIFASELGILEKLIKKLKLASTIGQFNISQLKPGSGCLVNIHTLMRENFNLY